MGSVKNMVKGFSQNLGMFLLSEVNDLTNYAMDIWWYIMGWWRGLTNEWTW